MGRIAVFKLNNSLVTNRRMTSKEIKDFVNRIWNKKWQPKEISK